VNRVRRLRVGQIGQDTDDRAVEPLRVLQVANEKVGNY
jgi:hypothetical protein